MGSSICANLLSLLWKFEKKKIEVFVNVSDASALVLIWGGYSLFATVFFFSLCFNLFYGVFLLDL